MLSARQIINRLCLLYLVFFLFFLITRYSYQPSSVHLAMQMLLLVLGGITSNIILTSRKTSTLTGGIFLFQFIASTAMRYMNYSIYGDWLGFNPQDAAVYRDNATTFLHLSILEMCKDALLAGISFDDLGYNIIILSVFKIFGPSLGLQMLIVANSLTVALGARLLFKLSLRFVNSDLSKGTAVIWGIMPFAVYTSSVGLKENFFAFCTISSIYYMHKYLDQNRLRHILLFAFWTATLSLFRTALTVMPLAALIAHHIMNKKSIRKHLPFFIALTVIAGGVFFKEAVNFVSTYRNYSYDDLSSMQQESIDRSGGMIATATNYLAGFIGPFPNFISKDEKVNYITLYSFTPFIKTFISFFFLYALIKIIKNRATALIPMLTFTLLDIVMLIFTFYTLHDRFQWPHIPFTLILSAWGYQQYHLAKKPSKLYAKYIIGIILLIIVFNFR